MKKTILDVMQEKANETIRRKALENKHFIDEINQLKATINSQAHVINQQNEHMNKMSLSISMTNAAEDANIQIIKRLQNENNELLKLQENHNHYLDLEKKYTEQAQELSALKDREIQLSHTIETLQILIEQKDSLVQQLQQSAISLSNTLSNLSVSVLQKDSLLLEKDRIIKEKETEIAEKNLEILELQQHDITFSNNSDLYNKEQNDTSHQQMLEHIDDQKDTSHLAGFSFIESVESFMQ